MTWKNPFDATFAYRRRRTLAAGVAGALLLNAAVAAAVTYPLLRSSRALTGEAGAAARRAESLEEARTRLAAAEEQIHRNREGAAEFYDGVLSTKRDRLTVYMREIREMARMAGIKITSIGHSTEALKEPEGVVRFGTTLPVEGTYDAVRRFISDIENHPGLFLTINGVSLRSMATARFDQVKIDMTVSTYFLYSSEDAPFPAEEPSAGEEPGAGEETAAPEEPEGEEEGAL